MQHSTDSASCASGYASVVEVLQGKVEALSLDAQVDVLVSEPMGTLLVNERMLETYIYARNRYLKKGGRMFPVSMLEHHLRMRSQQLHGITLSCWATAQCHHNLGQLYQVSGTRH